MTISEVVSAAPQRGQEDTVLRILLGLGLCWLTPPFPFISSSLYFAFAWRQGRDVDTEYHGCVLFFYPTV